MTLEPGASVADSDSTSVLDQPGPGVIVFVEDDETLRGIVASYLRRQGFAITEARSAEEAVRVLGAGIEPALVLLDVNLPGGTGWDLLRSQAMHRAGAPPVVIASAVAVSPRRLAEFGVAGYLPKPFPLETLLQTVDRVLSAADTQGAADADD